MNWKSYHCLVDIDSQFRESISLCYSIPSCANVHVKCCYVMITISIDCNQRNKIKVLTVLTVSIAASTSKTTPIGERNDLFNTFARI